MELKALLKERNRTMKKILKLAALAGGTALMIALLTGCGDKAEKSDWEYVKDKGVLTIGLDDTFAPMGFRDKDDKIVGFDIDLAKAVGKELGVKVKFQPIDWDAKDAELKSKNIDCVWNGMSANPDRAKSMSLSKTYIENKILVMSYKKELNIKDASELKNIKLGTQADSSALDLIKTAKNYDEFKDNVSDYPTYDEALLDMKAGRIDAVAIDEIYAIYNNANKEKLYQSDFNFGGEAYAVGFRKEDAELTKKVNEALEKTSESGKAEKISKKWFNKNLFVLADYKG